jgi:hypothetical protein
MVQTIHRQLATHRLLPFLSKDFELVPRMVTKAQLGDAFRCSRFGPAGSVPAGEHGEEGDALPGGLPEDLARICFEEFADAIGRLALFAFKFQVWNGKEGLRRYAWIVCIQNQGDDDNGVSGPCI